MKPPAMHKPCVGCPFRKDCLRGWLGKDRMTEILKAQSFACHKTTQGEAQDRRQCAGHMIIKGEQNQFFRLAKRLNISLNLSGSELVFESDNKCIEHHTEQ